ncbi:hypothetical protein [uncultured Enterovirga sp.]
MLDPIRPESKPLPRLTRILLDVIMPIAAVLVMIGALWAGARLWGW